MYIADIQPYIRYPIMACLPAITNFGRVKTFHLPYKVTITSSTHSKMTTFTRIGLSCHTLQISAKSKIVCRR